jgi:hypothetical protein
MLDVWTDMAKLFLLSLPHLGALLLLVSPLSFGVRPPPCSRLGVLELFPSLRLLGLSRPLGVLLPIVVVLFLPLHALVSPPGALGVSPFPSLLELSPSLLELSPSLLGRPLGLRFLLLLMPPGLDLPPSLLMPSLVLRLALVRSWSCSC